MYESSSVVSDKDRFLSVLRENTNPAHKALEELSLSKQIINPELTLPAYTLYLSRMYVYVREFETKLFPLLASVFSDLDQRRKTTWIEKDLEVLKTKTALPSLPSFEIIPNPSLAYEIGRMYVLEGSTLGGKFINKNVQKVLGLDETQGAAYFNGYGAETGKKWSNFLEQFSNFALSSHKEEEIIHGANDAFETMYRLLKD